MGAPSGTTPLPSPSLWWPLKSEGSSLEAYNRSLSLCLGPCMHGTGALNCSSIHGWEAIYIGVRRGCNLGKIPTSCNVQPTLLNQKPTLMIASMQDFCHKNASEECMQHFMENADVKSNSFTACIIIFVLVNFYSAMHLMVAPFLIPLPICPIQYVRNSECTGKYRLNM